MKQLLEAVNRFFTKLSSLFPHRKDNSFEASAEVLSHAIAYGPNDGEIPRCITSFMLDDPAMIEKYGLVFEINSRFLFDNTKKGEHITLRLEENPDYDPNDAHSQRLILAEDQGNSRT